LCRLCRQSGSFRTVADNFNSYIAIAQRRYRTQQIVKPLPADYISDESDHRPVGRPHRKV